MSRPPGPYIPPVVLHDDEGRFTVFTGKFCPAPGCGLQLTSRNRYGLKLLCKGHGKEKDRERYVGRRSVPAAKKRKTYPADPEKQAVHAALGNWLAFPTEASAATRLRVAMVDYEVRHRLRAILPDVASPQALPTIPLEETSFTNPEHRTTRTEFLSDAKTYGV